MISCVEFQSVHQLDGRSVMLLRQLLSVDPYLLLQNVHLVFIILGFKIN